MADSASTGAGGDTGKGDAGKMLGDLDTDAYKEKFPTFRFSEEVL